MLEASGKHDIHVLNLNSIPVLQFLHDRDGGLSCSEGEEILLRDQTNHQYVVLEVGCSGRLSSSRISFRMEPFMTPHSSHNLVYIYHRRTVLPGRP
nr:hypothetical protein CFP56_56512 [Quercus suber]